MGGFAGGDEGGYWDVDSISNLVDKRKISKKNNFHIETNNSIHTIKVYQQENLEELSASISFVPHKCKSFTIEGCDGIHLESNSIYKAYKALNEFIIDSDVLEFFESHKIVLIKDSSSSVTAFMRLVKEVCNLMVSNEELEEIGSRID